VIVRIDPEAALVAIIATLRSQLDTLRVQGCPIFLAYTGPDGSPFLLTESNVERVLRNMARNVLAIAMADEVGEDVSG
jgi:hypothetical protein